MGGDRKVIRIAGMLVCLVAACPVAFGDVGFQFQKIVDTNMPALGGLGNYTGFSDPTTSAFVGSYAGGSAAYGFGGAFAPALVKLADTGTAIPGGAGNFASFNTPAPAPGRYVFRATGSGGQEGIYVANTNDGTLKLIADHNTPIPGGTGNFTLFGGSPSISASSNSALFYAEGTGGQKGVYNKAATTAGVAVADTATVAPGSGGLTFTAFGQEMAFRFGYPAFPGVSGGLAGLYGVPIGGGPLATVIDHATSIAGQGGLTLRSVSGTNASTDSGTAVIATFSTTGLKGVFTPSQFPGNQVDTVAKIFDPVPQGTAVFTNFLQVGLTTGTIEGGPMTIFSAVDSEDGKGIYAQLLYSHQLERVIATGMALDGKQVSDVGMTAGSVNSYNVTFRAEFTDGSSGIYVATANLPEPGAAAAAVSAGLAVLLRRRGRRVDGSRRRP